MHLLISSISQHLLQKISDGGSMVWLLETEQHEVDMNILMLRSPNHWVSNQLSLLLVTFHTFICSNKLIIEIQLKVSLLLFHHKHCNSKVFMFSMLHQFELAVLGSFLDALLLCITMHNSYSNGKAIEFPHTLLNLPSSLHAGNRSFFLNAIIFLL